MGRDWSWLGGGKKKSSSKLKKDIKATPPSSSPTGNTATAAAGCMSAVFNIFDLQHLQFPINHRHLHLPKGVDAEETPCSPTRKDGNLNISQMGIKIKTKPQARTSSSSSSSSSQAATESYSPSVKTPTLVARLMGLDLVPDNYISSPTPSCSCSSSSHTNKHRHYSLQRNSVDGATRSLPETPRISLGRRSVDVNSYQHQRSSLHRDNVNVTYERESGLSNVRLKMVKEMKIQVEDKENRSPRDYARQIVMQLKENVSGRRRRMGTDITNKEQQSREVHEPKKASKITNVVAPKIMKVRDDPILQTVQEEVQGTEQDGKQSKSATKRKKAENFQSRLVKPPRTMQEEPFVRSPATSNNNTKKKDSSKLRVTQSSRNRASTEFTTFQSQSPTHVSPITKRTLVLVDDLVAEDFPETVTQSELTFDEEGEGIVTELERGIFKALVTEMMTDFDSWIKTTPLRETMMSVARGEFT